MLALTTGLVAAFFSVMYQALEEFFAATPKEQFKELLVIVITSAGMLLAIEPILERISPIRIRERTRRQDSLLIHAGALITIVATALLHGLLHAHISQSLSLHGMLVIEQILTALLAPFLITLSWIRGARRAGSEARWYGFAAGLVAGLALVGAAIVQLYCFHPSLGMDRSSEGGAAAMVTVATSLMWFVIPSCAANGYLGGLAIDRQWTGKVWTAALVGLMIAAAVEAGMVLLTSSFEFEVLKSAALLEPDSIASLMAEAVVGNLGWAMGLLVRPDADALLRGSSQTNSGRAAWSEAISGLTAAAAMLTMGTFIAFAGIILRGYVAAAFLAKTH